MFTVERLPDVGDRTIPIGAATGAEGLIELLDDRSGTYMIRHGDKRVRWEFDPVYGGPHRDEYRAAFRAQVGEIVKALEGRA